MGSSNVSKSIFEFLEKNALVVLAGGSFIVAVLLVGALGLFPEGFWRYVGLTFIVLCILCFFVTTSILAIQRLPTKKARIDVGELGKKNCWCDVIQSYQVTDYSKQAVASANEKAELIFTFCAFNPTEIVEELASHKHRTQRKRDKRAYDPKDYSKKLKEIRGYGDGKFRKVAEKEYPHLRKFKDKVIRTGIPIESQEHKKHCWVIRILLMTDDYESKYEQSEKGKGKYYNDFKKFKLLNGRIPCFVLPEGLCKDKEDGLDVLECTDFAIFLYSNKKRILGWDEIVNKTKGFSDKDLILDYYRESYTIIVSSGIPKKRKNDFFYHKIFSKFFEKYQDRDVLISLPTYMNRKFNDPITARDRAIFNLLGIKL